MKREDLNPKHEPVPTAAELAVSGIALILIFWWLA